LKVIPIQLFNLRYTVGRTFVQNGFAVANPGHVSKLAVLSTKDDVQDDAVIE